MPAEDIKAPGRKSLLTAAAAAVLMAGIVLSYGFIGRAQSKQEVVDWTNTHAIPTVALAGLIPGSSHQTLTLPGNIQPFSRAAIFARVNGYVKSWDHDIGSPVKAGQVLATIDAPDLDQQLGQAKATLASVRANHQIATLTANRNNILVQKQIVAQQLADQTAADATAKQAVVDANEANVRQLEAMQSFKTLAAPFDGVVTARNVELGQLINSGGSGQPLFEVSDLHRVRIYVQVPQSFSACGGSFLLWAHPWIRTFDFVVGFALFRISGLLASTGICFKRSTNHRPAGPGGDLVCQTADIARIRPSGGTSSIGSTERRPSSRSLRTTCKGIPPQPRPLSRK